ncbi:hypothetical protein Enr13x_30130 [Stieleria neptunia]|uniref:O-Antigen ligase n=1 Tax=Stieleria neptunia TaxID=2527979 RepID=A0A518HQM8_9BACT|nr:hypothetical protein [Stieleria neptunia]QDV43159.1 hypothetical protein Enr13x_30130 [Stieleria neptunia]
MITSAYFGVLAVACLIAFINWHQAVYWAIALDFARDPVRKLDPNESVLITISVLILWGCISIAAWVESRGWVKATLREHPMIHSALRFMAIALVPGCIMSLALYADGYKMVALGVVSYLAPAAGIMLGYLIALRPDRIRRFLQFYCVVNGVALIGVLAEYSQANWPAIGGLRGMNWIRYSGNETVELIGGFYRSPDIMGLHAAQVVMFALTLATYARRRLTPLWLALAVFGSLCLLLSGRRKMLGMPLVFLASLALLCHLRAIRRFRQAAIPVVASAALAAGIYLVSTEDYVSTEYMNYASTLFTEGAERYTEIVSGSIASTIAQSGLVGEGIGSATQGAYHFVGEHRDPFARDLHRGWQEDGVSRVFRELGVFGVAFVLLAGWALTMGLRDAVTQTPAHWRDAVLQLCLISIVVANLASFTVSHQQYSGDPPSALLVLIMLGFVLALSPTRSIRALRRLPGFQ